MNDAGERGALVLLDEAPIADVLEPPAGDVGERPSPWCTGRGCSPGRGSRWNSHRQEWDPEPACTGRGQDDEEQLDESTSVSRGTGLRRRGGIKAFEGCPNWPAGDRQQGHAEYSLVKLMCSHPSGEMWARNSAGIEGRHAGADGVGGGRRVRQAAPATRPRPSPFTRGTSAPRVAGSVAASSAAGGARGWERTSRCCRSPAACRTTSPIAWISGRGTTEAPGIRPGARVGRVGRRRCLRLQARGQIRRQEPQADPAQATGHRHFTFVGCATSWSRSLGPPALSRSGAPRRD